MAGFNDSLLHHALGLYLVAALKAHRLSQHEDRHRAADWTELDLVFTTHSGRSLGHRNTLREFYKLLQKAGLPKTGWHTLRHCTASHLLNQNVHPKLVQEILGHRGISTTVNIYSHIIPSLGRDAANKMGDVLG